MLAKNGYKPVMRFDMFSGNQNRATDAPAVEWMNDETHINRGGRPPLAPHKARSSRVVTFVTDNELCKLQDLAAEENLSLSAVCHLLINESLTAHNNKSRKQG